MAKLATIAEAHDLDTDTCIARLIDGYFSAPHSPLGQDVTKVMQAGAQAQMSTNPLMQIFSSLPPETQNQLVQKVVGTFLGQKGASSDFL